MKSEADNVVRNHDFREDPIAGHSLTHRIFRAFLYYQARQY